MSRPGSETAFIQALRAIATHPGAGQLRDDAAVLEIGGARLVLTHDMIVESVHYLPDDPADDVAWKLVAVNLSDLAAKGARPVGALLGYALGGETWDRDFLRGLREALANFDAPLLGGDTVAMPAGAPRAFGLTALGLAGTHLPLRSGAKPGDALYVTGTIGDAGAGLDLLRSEFEKAPELTERYRRPTPRLAAGQALAPLVSAMMDVSDGLLIDALHLARESGCAITLDLAAMPLSPAFATWIGEDRDARLRAAMAGDDYELLFTAAPGREPEIIAVGQAAQLKITRLGACRVGEGLALEDQGEPVALPARLGFEHRR